MTAEAALAVYPPEMERDDVSYVIAVATRDPRPGPLLHDLGDSAQFVMVTSGVSDVSLARNCQLSRALDNRLPIHDGQDPEVVVMFDDDSCVNDTTARILANTAREHAPVSAVYCARGEPHKIAATLFGRPKGQSPLLAAGLGACAIHRNDLVRLRAVSASFKIAGELVTEFTWSGTHGVPVRRWLSEDYRLWSRLQTVGADLRLIGLAVGHRDSEGRVWRPMALASIHAEEW